MVRAISFSLWGYLRIKRETFDISGGWVGGGTPNGQALTLEPYLKPSSARIVTYIGVSLERNARSCARWKVPL